METRREPFDDDLAITIEYGIYLVTVRHDDTFADLMRESPSALKALRLAHAILSEKVAMLDRYDATIKYLKELPSDECRKCIIENFCICGNIDTNCTCRNEE